MKRIILTGFLLGFTACTSAPKDETRPAVRPRANQTWKVPKTAAPQVAAPIAEGPSIDYDGLQRFLKLDRSFSTLGYSERMFNTCEVGYGFSGTNDCQKRFFVVSHFQLKCRDSEGTISQILTAADLRPISRRTVNWTLKDASGSLMTDSEGYGQIAMVSPRSQRAERLKLGVDNDFLYLRAGELKEMITPKNWCN